MQSNLLQKITHFCDTRVHKDAVTDFNGAHNGLQFENNGEVTKIGSAVDAGLHVFQKAQEQGIDFLIVHHGMFWSSTVPITGINYQKTKFLLEHNMAVYGAHLPLDCHREIGNNALIAKKLGLTITDWVIPYEGIEMVPICDINIERQDLENRLKALFPTSFTSISTGPKTTKRIAICSGSGVSVVPELKKYGIDTFITGEIKQHCFNYAQEEQLNLYPCGHYASEVFGVQALAQEVADKFNLPHVFIRMECPL